MAKRFRGEWAESLPYTDKAFQPLAIALGQLALCWNDLHQSLGLVFCSVMGGGYIGQFLAIWNALKADRAQREILIAAIKNEATPVQQGQTDAYRKQILEDVKWLCGKVDAMEDTRNDALHVPFWGTRDRKDKTTVVPVTGLGHRGLSR
jgi:hypothetical protein